VEGHVDQDATAVALVIFSSATLRIATLGNASYDSSGVVLSDNIEADL